MEGKNILIEHRGAEETSTVSGSPGTAVMDPTMSWKQGVFYAMIAAQMEVGEESRWTT